MPVRLGAVDPQAGIALSQWSIQTIPAGATVPAGFRWNCHARHQICGRLFPPLANCAQIRNSGPVPVNEMGWDGVEDLKANGPNCSALAASKSPLLPSCGSEKFRSGLPNRHRHRRGTSNGFSGQFVIVSVPSSCPQVVAGVSPCSPQSAHLSNRS